MHLWYLWILFIYTLLCYGLFAWLTGSGRKLLEAIGRGIATPGLIYVWLSCPLLLLYLIVPKPVLLVGQGGWGFFFYLWFLIAGFIIYSSEPLQRLIKNQRWVSFGLVVILSAIYLYYRFAPSDPAMVKTSYDLPSAVLSFLSSWTCLLAILGFGMRYLDFDRPRLKYLNEGVLPFYILHQTVIQAIGFFIIQWDLDDFLKWIFIALSSFISIMVLYLALIRKSQALRFLFGMKSDSSLVTWFAKPIPLISVHLLYVGLIMLAVFNGKT
jgi:glucan biosynthesis protein C